MTKTLAVAASVVMLMTIAGPAFAETTVRDAQYGIDAITPSGRQAVYAFNAFDRSAATETGVTNAYRYHGRPKSKD